MDKFTGQLSYNPQTNLFTCEGDWLIQSTPALQKQVDMLSLPQSSQLSISGAFLKQLDSAGALLLSHFMNKLKTLDNQVSIKEFKKEHQDMLFLVQNNQAFLEYTPPPPEKKSFLHQLGEQTIHKLSQAQSLIIMIGALSDKIVKALYQLRRFHFPSIVTTIYDTGVTALPIIGLLSFLIGVVLAYQMGLQLETYGANIFIAFLSGMAIFREFSPLITAIIVAGRTSSAFTAQIGSMKINEEIDALYTMGLSPTELLVVPRVIGLILVFPLLIFWSALFATLGAMLMSKMMLEVSYIDFLNRLQSSVGFRQLALGLYKAPTFAILIAVVGCLQGLMVESNADSIGRQTTKSVVQALFLIIVADAAYSIIYSWLAV